MWSEKHLKRKNISISDEDLENTSKLVKKHQGNFSSAIRELIDFYFFVQESCGTTQIARYVIENYARKEIEFSKPLQIGDKLILNVEGILRKGSDDI